MPRSPQDVTDAELAILEVLWDRAAATVREIAEQLYAAYSASQHATTQKLLERLEAKDFVRRDRARWPHVFEPAVDRETLIGRRLQQTADRLCDGSIQPLLTHLVKAGRLSAAERRSLRNLLDELEAAGDRPTGRRQAKGNR
ncbi:MAG TPA: BlaI/MecI/CopY family transcriptional regulator [Pirellulales bacterium]|jgi:predicted transcriptional regulator|nr:BlaI/MecI/CopY family transcriptional regulator [Pirellulales bacterium]